MLAFQPKISVIIPTRNEEGVIQECLSSIFEQSLRPYEVIIVDGHSTDDTLNRASKFPVKVFFESKPSSLPNARNIGISKATGDLLLIMDADTILLKDCLKNAVKYFDAPKVYAVIPSPNLTTHTRLEKIQAQWLSGTANNIRNGIGIFTFVQFFRKKVFETISFDPDLGYGEDDDFQERLRQQLDKIDGKIVNANDCKISVHYPHTWKELRSQWTWWGRTFLRYLNKHKTIRTFLILGSVLAPSTLLVLCFLSLFFIQAFPFFIIILSLLLARSIIACYRSKSLNLLQFIGFEFIRSAFFITGVIQGFFSEERGK
jgi:glycosyltransferase involved in cell wall biosynthesis